MILRRVIGHFRKQEWTAIAIDFLIVVIGVFVGLQVNDWNEARQDRRDERFYLARLREDLLNAEKFASRMLKKRIDKRDALTSATLTLLGKSGRETLGEAECNAVGVSHVFNLELTELSALTELRSSGRLSIMTDEGIRSALIALQQSQQVLARSMDSGEADTVPLPEAFPSLVAADLYVVDGTDGQTRLKYVCDVAAMRDDRAFLTVLSGNAQRYDDMFAFIWSRGLRSSRPCASGSTARLESIVQSRPGTLIHRVGSASRSLVQLLTQVHFQASLQRSQAAAPSIAWQ